MELARTTLSEVYQQHEKLTLNEKLVVGSVAVALVAIFIGVALSRGSGAKVLAGLTATPFVYFGGAVLYGRTKESEVKEFNLTPNRAGLELGEWNPTPDQALESALLTAIVANASDQEISEALNGKKTSLPRAGSVQEALNDLADKAIAAGNSGYLSGLKKQYQSNP